MYGACDACGCAYHECECGPDRAVFDAARLRKALDAIKAVETAKQKPRLRVGMWVRINAGPMFSCEGRVAHLGSKLVEVQQLNGTALVVPRDVVELALRGTTWSSLADQLGSRL